MHLGANVLLPEGWDTHPDARYPLFINHASSGVLPAEAGSVTRNCNGSGLGSSPSWPEVASLSAWSLFSGFFLSVLMQNNGIHH